MRSKNKLVLLVVGVLVGLGLLSAGALASMGAFTGPTDPGYITETAKVADVEKAVLATGTLQPFEVVQVGSTVSGEIVRLPVTLGQKVKVGEIIAEIDSQQLKNRLRDRESQLQSQMQMITNFQSNLAFAEANMQRQQTLKDRGVASQMQYDQAANQLRQSKAQLGNFEGQLKTAQINVEAAQNDLDKATIRAPMEGVVAEIVAVQGQTLNANNQAPTIVRLAKMDTMTVRTQVSEADIVKVKPGQKVYFTVLGDPDKRYYATLRTREVTPAGGVLDPNIKDGPKAAVYYNALFEVPNPKGELFPAMTANVHVVLDEVKNVVTIPLTALGPQGPDGRYLVRVLGRDGKPEERQVAIGLTSHSLAEVKNGIRAGDRVIIAESQSKKKQAARGPLLPGLTAPKQ